MFLVGCLMHALSEQEGLSSEADSGAQHRRLAALQEWLVERMGRGPPRIAHLPDHLLFSFLPAAFTLFVQPGSNPSSDLTAQQCQVCDMLSCHGSRVAWHHVSLKHCIQLLPDPSWVCACARACAHTCTQILHETAGLMFVLCWKDSQLLRATHICRGIKIIHQRPCISRTVFCVQW